MQINRKSLASPRIELMPLIDIVFLLLVFFIYAMLSMAIHHGQSVDLPDTSSAALETNEAIAVTIQATKQGALLFVDEEQVSLTSLSEKLRQATGGNRKKEVQIFADKSLPYQDLFQVLDHIKQTGLNKISLQAVPENSAP